MIDLRCLIGRHEWWARSTWPLVLQRDVLSTGSVTAVCGRCPKRKYR